MDIPQIDKLAGFNLLDRFISARPLRNGPTVSTPPGTGLVLRIAGGRVLPRFLSSVRCDVQQLQCRKHQLDATPFRFVRLKDVSVALEVAAKIASIAGRQSCSGIGSRVPRCCPSHEVTICRDLIERAAAISVDQSPDGIAAGSIHIISQTCPSRSAKLQPYINP